MKIAFIHNEKKIGTGAHFINDLISSKLRQHGVIVKHFYPSTNLLDTPINLKGLGNILFFFSLLEHRDEILKCDLIQGTTYTPLTFLAYDIPVIAHFGSTTKGFLDAGPTLKNKTTAEHAFWLNLKKEKVVKEVNLRTRRPLNDIAGIEKFVATRSDSVIATSERVKKELVSLGVKPEKISIIHNAIEDYWFTKKDLKINPTAHLLFLGRLGNDFFNLKLKGLDHLYSWYGNYPEIEKLTVGITTNDKLSLFMDNTLPKHQMMSNVEKKLLPEILSSYAGSIFFIPSRYEGFSLSLIEGMSQGLIPIIYSVGVAPEIIKNGVNGFIVKDQIEVKRHTDKLLKDPKLREKMAIAAHASAMEFQADKMAKEFIKEYQKVLANAEVRTTQKKSLLRKIFG